MAEQSDGAGWLERYDPAEDLPLDEALSILGEETRARILAELGAAADPEDARPGVLSFSELMDRVGVEDSGRFNYHLGELVGTFVRKVEDGYRLHPSGHLVYRAVVAGTLTDRRRIDPFEAGDCPACGAALSAEYPANHCLYVRCDDCGEFFHGYHLPNRAARDRSGEAALDAAVRKGNHETGLLRQGVCHACSAPVERELRTDDPGVCGRRCEYDVYAVYSCTACNVGGIGHPAHAALTTPPVVGFLDDHGLEASAVPPWSDVVTDAEAGASAVGDGDRPGAVEVPFEAGGERLTVRLDGDLQVRRAERTAVATGE